MFFSNSISRKAKEEYVRMKKERDYHRMHHHRVAQEKNKLITDIKRIKTHYESFEPLVKNMKEKYENALRDKVLNQLERERAVAELKSIKQLENLSLSKSTKHSFFLFVADLKIFIIHFKFKRRKNRTQYKSIRSHSETPQRISNLRTKY